MKPGRPVNHFKAKYISWIGEDHTEFYTLDGKGNLEKIKDGTLMPHHECPTSKESNSISLSTVFLSSIKQDLTLMSNSIFSQAEDTMTAIDFGNFLSSLQGDK